MLYYFACLMLVALLCFFVFSLIFLCNLRHITRRGIVVCCVLAAAAFLIFHSSNFVHLPFLVHLDYL